MSNEMRLQEKITREQAQLEATGRITISANNKSIEVIKITFNDAVGYKVANKIHADAGEAIAAARREIGGKISEQVNVVIKEGTLTSLKAVSSGLIKLSDLAKTGIYILSR